MESYKFREALRSLCGRPRDGAQTSPQQMQRDLQCAIARMVRRIIRRRRATSRLDQFLLSKIETYLREALNSDHSREQLIQSISRRICEALITEMRSDFVTMGGFMETARTQESTRILPSPRYGHSVS